jgi:hypothetical protein
MAKEVEEPWNRDDPNGMSDPMVVRTSELKRAIEIWAKDRNFSEDPTEKFEGKIALGRYLENESGVGVRLIWAIMKGESKVTTFVNADKIIAAIERPDLMPEVIPNPRWSQERWLKYMEERGCI